MDSSDQSLMEEVRNDTRDVIPTDEILGSFVREGVLKGEGRGVEVILRVDIEDETKDGRSS